MKYTLAILAALGAVQASPFAFPAPQAVTAKISPSAPPPSGCTVNYPSTFGWVVMNVTSASGAQAVTTKSDGQPNASSGTVATAAPVKTISDGQPQASSASVKTPSMASVSAVKTISDGQPQAPTGTASMMMMTGAPVMQISDGQVQGMMHTMTMMPVSQSGTVKTITMMPVSTIKDGQPQAPTMPATSTVTGSAVKTISDGQPQAPTGAATATATASAVKTISDGQPQAPTGSSAVATASAVKTISDGQPQASTGKASSSSAAASSTPMVMVACNTNSTLQVTLSNGVLTDNVGRTGYIASNYQLQFDKPPQAGAIYTAGFSICANGSLALGGSETFYQCLSGSFYNLYNTNWAAQCSPVNINVVQLVTC